MWTFLFGIAGVRAHAAPVEPKPAGVAAVEVSAAAITAAATGDADSQRRRFLVEVSGEVAQLASGAHGAAAGAAATSLIVDSKAREAAFSLLHMFLLSRAAPASRRD